MEKLTDHILENTRSIYSGDTTWEDLEKQIQPYEKETNMRALVFLLQAYVEGKDYGHEKTKTQVEGNKNSSATEHSPTKSKTGENYRQSSHLQQEQ